MFSGAFVLTANWTWSTPSSAPSLRLPVRVNCAELPLNSLISGSEHTQLLATANAFRVPGRRVVRPVPLPCRTVRPAGNRLLCSECWLRFHRRRRARRTTVAVVCVWHRRRSVRCSLSPGPGIGASEQLPVGMSKQRTSLTSQTSLPVAGRDLCESRSLHSRASRRRGSRQATPSLSKGECQRLRRKTVNTPDSATGGGQAVSGESKKFLPLAGP